LIAAVLARLRSLVINHLSHLSLSSSQPLLCLDHTALVIGVLRQVSSLGIVREHALSLLLAVEVERVVHHHDI